MTGYDGRNGDKLVRIDWYPSDYLTDPKVLVMTPLQELAYFRLLNFQARGGPLAFDLASLAVLARSATDEFESKIWPGIKTCFIVEEGHVLNERMERERDLAKSKIDTAREAGRRGGLKTAAKHREKQGSLERASSTPSKGRSSQQQQQQQQQHENSPSGESSTPPPAGRSVHKPRRRSAKTSEPDAAMTAGADVEAAPVSTPAAMTPDGLVNLWSATCASLPQPRRPLVASTTKTLETAIKRERDRDWLATFSRVSASDFLSGRVTAWKAALSWVVKPANIAKIDDGNYDNVDTPTKSRGGYTADRDAKMTALEKRKIAEAEAMQHAQSVYDEPNPF